MRVFFAPVLTVLLFITIYYYLLLFITIYTRRDRVSNLQSSVEL